MEKCNIIFPFKDLQDVSGCLKEDNHVGSHVFKTDKNKLVAWEDDGECNCGCWDDYDRGSNKVCVVYTEVDNISKNIN